MTISGSGRPALQFGRDVLWGVCWAMKEGLIYQKWCLTNHGGGWIWNTGVGKEIQRNSSIQTVLARNTHRSSWRNQLSNSIVPENWQPLLQETERRCVWMVSQNLLGLPVYHYPFLLLTTCAGKKHMLLDAQKPAYRYFILNIRCQLIIE
jgi:hypothetical protein